MYKHRRKSFFKRVCYFCISALFVFLICISSPLRSQFMRLEIFVEEDFSIAGFIAMDFGQFPPNSGWVALNINDIGAGQMGLTAEENIQLKVRIIPPSELVLNANNTMPFRLEAAYLQDGSANTREAIPFRDNTATFQLSHSGLLVDKMDPRLHRLKADVYFFGQVYAGDVSPGIYSGTIGVQVEYN